MSGAGDVTASAKIKEVGSLLKTLEDGRGGPSKDEAGLTVTLTKLKIHSREPMHAKPMYCKSGISVLASYAFAASTPSSQEALSCIANALFLAPQLRQDFIDLDLLDKAANRLKSEDYKDEFLVSRIIFLLTYGTTLNHDELLRNLSVASTINSHLIHHAEAYERRSNEYMSNDMATMALSEILKLLFNLSTHQTTSRLFQPALKSIMSILGCTELCPRCLDPPTGLLINTLVNLDLGPTGSQEEWSPSPVDFRALIEKLISILETSLKSYKETELETSLPPLLTVLSKIYDIGDSSLRMQMQVVLLPAHEERELPLGMSDTMPSRLLRLSSSAMAPTLRTIIPALMFKLSDQDPKKFVENIGYGYAAGFLASHNIATPDNAKQTQHAPSISSEERPINPITGQRLDKEPEDTGPPMTMEEKEREAERLFVLFERLRATGVVNVQNPVEAMNNGKQASRIEEIDESD